MRHRVKNGGVLLAKPISRLLDFNLDAFERLALVVRAKVLDILQEKYSWLVPTEFPDDSSDVEEQEAAFILEAKLLARNGKWLAWKAGG